LKTWRALLLLGASTLSACGLVVGIEDHYLASIDGGVTYGGDGSDAGGLTQDAGTTDPRNDGSAALCRNGILTAVRVTDISPPDAGSVVCNLENALVRDDAVAGLDRSSYENWGTIDAHDVNGCLAVEFDRAISAAHLRLESVGNACGYACAESSCGQAQDAAVFAGPSLGELRFIETPALPRSMMDLTLPVPASTRVIAICRRAWSKDGDDVAVDSVTADCIVTDE
jgi:hypothetical protein